MKTLESYQNNSPRDQDSWKKGNPKRRARHLVPLLPSINYGLKCDSWEAEQAMAAKWPRSWTQLLAFSWGYGGQFGFTSWQIEKVLVNTPDFPVKLLTKNKVELEIGNLNKSWFLGWEDSLEEGMATHSSILAWRILMDRGAWWATVHGVAKIQTQLSD